MTAHGAQALRPARRRRFSARQRRAARRWAIYAFTIVLIVWAALNADWVTLQQTFFDPEIFAGLFPEIVTVAVKNTVILALLAFAGGWASAFSWR
jgi:polar amino acid transport system permease protein